LFVDAPFGARLPLSRAAGRAVAFIRARSNVCGDATVQFISQLISQRSHLVLSLLAAAVAAACASMQTPPASGSAASVTSGGLEYQSAFESYRAYEELEPLSWQRANEDAGALGGHGGQMKPAATSMPSQVSKPDGAAEAKKAPAAAASPPAAAAQPAAVAAPQRTPAPAAQQKPSAAPAATAPAGAGHAGHGK